jgi:hypothetical protein
MAPDAGNDEIILHFGACEYKKAVVAFTGNGGQGPLLPGHDNFTRFNLHIGEA